MHLVGTKRDFFMQYARRYVRPHVSRTHTSYTQKGRKLSFREADTILPRQHGSKIAVGEVGGLARKSSS